MPVVIHTNVSALNIQRVLAGITNNQQKSLQRLASGHRINQAHDDAAGLQISEALRAQYRGIHQALHNAQDGRNMLASVEGTLTTVQDNLQRIRELTVQAANDSYNPEQRSALQMEIQARLDDINRITNASQWNGIKLLSATATPSNIVIQVGANNDVTGNTVDVGATGALGDTTPSTLGVETVDISTNALARDYLTKVDNALNAISQRRTAIGSLTSQLDSRIDYLEIARENLQASDSRLRDADIARESTKLTQTQILQNASTSLLAQANQNTFFALDLINQGR
jgi:flagellin